MVKFFELFLIQPGLDLYNRPSLPRFLHPHGHVLLPIRQVGKNILDGPFTDYALLEHLVRSECHQDGFQAFTFGIQLLDDPCFGFRL
jgi:hypothetical protein